MVRQEIIPLLVNFEQMRDIRHLTWLTYLSEQYSSSFRHTAYRVDEDAHVEDAVSYLVVSVTITTIHCAYSETGGQAELAGKEE